MPDLLYPDRLFSALLFDMDGTLLTSIACAERVWSEWAVAHGVEVATFLPTLHGRRCIDTIRSLNLPGIDVEAEARWITEREMVDVDGIEAIAGAAGFLARLPRDRWAIVTSASRELAQRRLAAAGLPEPPLLITCDDVANGKPSPDGYLLAARRLGVRIEDCVVFEDAPAGIAAAEAAGASVVVVTATGQQVQSARWPTLAYYGESMSADAL